MLSPIGYEGTTKYERTRSTSRKVPGAFNPDAEGISILIGTHPNGFNNPKKITQKTCPLKSKALPLVTK
jgi:hypothetical protein